MPVACPKCGEENRDGTLMCGMCGEVLNRPANQAPRPATSTMAPPVAPPPMTSAVPPPPIPSGYQQPYSPLTQYSGYAGFWIRFVAKFVDGFLLAIVIVPLALLIVGPAVWSLRTGGTPKMPDFMGVLFTVVAFAINIIYAAAFESSAKQATPGKMLCGLVVTDTYMERISFGRALGRAVLNYIILEFCGLLGLVVAFTEKKQGIHDFACSTLVMRK